MNMTIHDYLWGYNDSLIKVANRVVASWIPFERLGLMDRVSKKYYCHEERGKKPGGLLQNFCRCMMKVTI